MLEFIISGLIGCLLISLCTLNIYEILRYIWRMIPRMTAHPRLRVFSIVPLAFIGHILNIWIFGFVYFMMHTTGFGTLTGTDIASGKTPLDIFECLYFSAATYTTLGLGDVMPIGSIRMITGVESLTGFLLIGWTVSFTYLAMEKFWELPHKHHRRQ